MTSRITMKRVCITEQEMMRMARLKDREETELYIKRVFDSIHPLGTMIRIINKGGVYHNTIGTIVGYDFNYPVTVGIKHHDGTVFYRAIKEMEKVQ